MAGFSYTPYQFTSPQSPKLQGSTGGVPTQNISNTFAKSILDTMGRSLKPVSAYTQNNDINTALQPTQELGKQFIQQAMLPEFQKNTYNPFIRNIANRAAGSNLSLMGNAGNYVDTQKSQVTQPFIDKAQQVQDQFNTAAYNDANDLLKSFYGSQLNF